MRIIRSFWFTSSKHCIGIVVGQDEVTKADKAYIGVVDGGNIEKDEQSIAEHGAKFPVRAARQLI